jgi:predicted secreted acid phosphatase
MIIDTDNVSLSDCVDAIKDVLEKRYNKKFTFTMYFSDNFEEFEACIYKEEKEEENDI